ncbi:MAG: hypothetical protein GOVbin1709_83 [Prokaryotic dsDNA virus sp.]|nr:MAG: hypothetical protein GOVbin1709_83 [Prokaryotic dsDNA virus sp.]|tara:strand:+ start:6997 stop:7410 length:414 start_codon:yes stop_codon:yes gene_type:complete
MTKSKTLKDSFKDYKKEGGELDYIQYRDICEKYNQYIVNCIIEDTLEFKLPERLGSIRIRKIKGKVGGKRIDWALTKKYNKKIYHLNMHTDGYYYKWMWHKQDACFKNKSVYSFVAPRKAKRKMAGLLKENKIEFFN